MYAEQGVPPEDGYDEVNDVWNGLEWPGGATQVRETPGVKL